MVSVLDIWDEAKKIIGNSNDAFLLKRITDAVELLANKGDFDPLLGTMDICVRGQTVVLPREIETILALNMVGRPAVARDQLFKFHLNGPGDRGRAIEWEWSDLNDACILRELVCPVKLIAFCQDDADTDCELWVDGIDDAGNKLRTKIGEVWHDGYQVPVFKVSQAITVDAPTVARITGIRKSVTVGPVRLCTIEGTDQTGVLLGIFQSDETTPIYRKIHLSRCVPYIRIAFRRRTFKLTSKYDLIPLHNAQAVIMMLRALKAYDSPSGLPEAEAYEATAVRWLTEEQSTRNAPVVAPIQVWDPTPLLDPGDYMD